MRGVTLSAALVLALFVLMPSAAHAARGASPATALGLIAAAGLEDRWDRDRRYEPGRRWDRRYARERRWRGRYRWRTDCHTQWREGRRERVCRRVRYRR